MYNLIELISLIKLNWFIQLIKLDSLPLELDGNLIHLVQVVKRDKARLLDLGQVQELEWDSFDNVVFSYES